jgi:hypothetical protein
MGDPNGELQSKSIAVAWYLAVADVVGEPDRKSN